MSHQRRFTLSSRILKKAAGVTVAGMAMAGAAGAMAATPAVAAGGDPWAAVRQCESGGNYSLNDGSGFYGAYQFTQDSWNSLGLTGLPSSASPEVQDQAAQQLAARYGMSPWPVCGHQYGGSAPSSSVAYSAPAQTTTLQATPVASVTQYASTGSRTSTWTVGPRSVLDDTLVNQVRPDVMLVQRGLQRVGYSLAMDGQFGPVTARCTRQFQAAHGLAADGRVGPATEAALIQAVSG